MWLGCERETGIAGRSLLSACRSQKLTPNSILRSPRSPFPFLSTGRAPCLDPAFYSYAYPEPEGLATAAVRAEQAFFSRELGEFILPDEAVRTARNPRQTLMDFLDSTYVAAAETGKWDREALECARGVPRLPRPV